MGGGIWANAPIPTTLNIINCTIAGNAASEGGGVHLESPYYSSIKNSILWDNLPEELFTGSQSPLVEYSDIKGGYTGVGNISEDPLFFGIENYHLTLGSPCINAGTNNGAPEIDYDGEYRPQGLVVDIGADEYNFSDFDEDRDVDGLDLSFYNINHNGVDLAEFASNFGHTANHTQ